MAQLLMLFWSFLQVGLFSFGGGKSLKLFSFEIEISRGVKNIYFVIFP